MSHKKNTRDIINDLIAEYRGSIIGIIDGNATIEQQNNTIRILDLINFYTNQLMLFGNEVSEQKQTQG